MKRCSPLTQNEKTKLKLQWGSSPSNQISQKFHNIVLVRTDEKEALSIFIAGRCKMLHLMRTN